MSFEDLNNKNFLLYVMKHYDNPHCHSLEEFYEDLYHIKYIKRLFRRYKETKNFESLRIRLVLNHLIILNNVFGTETLVRILFLKIEKGLWPILKPFLVFLSYMPDMVYNINGENIVSSNIIMDKEIIKELRLI